MNLYDLRRWGTAVFLVAALALAAVFLYYSNLLIKDLSAQERERMQIWADATREIVNITSAEDFAPSTNFDFLLSIIEGNRNIPVLLTDDAGNIVNHRNFDLPEPIDSLNPLYISPANRAFLQKRLERLKESPNVIHIEIAPQRNQHLYYEDSSLLKSLSWYPYVQLAVMLLFIGVVYFAVVSTKKAEQNKVWVGLSKETAHQLGTPISSLMAWTEMLPSMGVDPEMVGEMDKDVRRLATIASRFGKIGSVPTLEPVDLNIVVRRASEYMATRISSRISLRVETDSEPLMVMLSEPLFEWVMENLVKNAVDAMEGHGRISVATRREDGEAIVSVTDTGRGIARKNFKTVFNPGYTTKKRGWGLGLALAKRIVNQYHNGNIFVAGSEPRTATTFRIELPLIKASNDGKNQA